MASPTITLFRVDAFQIAYNFGLLRYQQSNRAVENIALPLEILRLAGDELKVQLSRIVMICEDLKITEQTQTDDSAERELIDTAETVMNLRFHSDMVYNEMNSDPSIWVQTASGPELTKEHNSLCDLYDKAEDAMRAKIRELSAAVHGVAWNNLRTKSANRPAYVWYLGESMQEENINYLTQRTVDQAFRGRK